MSEVTFETVKEEKIDFGKNNFLEIATKKAVVPDKEDNIFVAISRGFYLPDGTKRYKKSIALPKDKEIIDKIVEILGKMRE